MDGFFTMFPKGRGELSYADLLEVNLLALAAKRGKTVEVAKVNDSNVRVILPSGRSVQGSDFDNLALAINGV